ncbi:hypothetical protein QNH10_19835 [Sporosarcina thermotolerans]|uniref:hypothetical protein n=1 Tax=Sporosarcina thermotolerans TaxID=633404 RepID=UPI0024BC92CC|nr:hypothetical protein [Sporosarcina thermotolerans]WHT48237.1 hypothetical protein QNH10_19835 [Sporosarcina thermotolerans]
MKRQQEVISRVKEQAVGMHTLVNFPKILGMADPYIDTNMSKKKIFQIGEGIFRGKSEMQTLRIPLEDSYEHKRVAAGAVLSIDFEKNKQALQEFLSPNFNEEIEEEAGEQ